MKRLTLVLALCIMSGPAFATCKSDAADKKLAGAALKSFMTKCEKDATTTCETNSKDKKLAGAAKTSHMKKCVGDAVGTRVAFDVPISMCASFIGTSSKHAIEAV